MVFNNKYSFTHITKTGGTSVGLIFDKTYGSRPINHSNVSEDELIKYISFIILRDPLDRFISNYEYNKKMTKLSIGSKISNRQLIKETKTFNEFVRQLSEIKNPCNGHFRKQVEWVSASHKHFLDFKKLDTEISRLLSHYGDENLIPEFKKTNTSKRKNFDYYYSDNEVHDIVVRLYKDDIKLYNSKFNVN